MGQLERYGLYVLCLVIFLILGVAIWGDDPGDADARGVKHPDSVELNVGARDGVRDGPRRDSAQGGTPSVTERENERLLQEDAEFLRRRVLAADKDRNGGYVDANGNRSGDPAGGGQTPSFGHVIDMPANVTKAGRGARGGKANVPGIGSPGIRPVQKGQVRSHTVLRGDRLEEISLTYLGFRSKWRRIAEANPEVDPDNLKIGAVLKIPPRKIAKMPKAAAKAIEHWPTGVPKTLEVRRNDSFARISKRLFRTEAHAQKIMKLNRISDPMRLQVGQVLKIPNLKPKK